MTTQTYGKNELVGLLTPLVLPLIRDRAVIGNPIPGDNANAGVSIGYGKYSVVLTTDSMRPYVLRSYSTYKPV